MTHVFTLTMRAPDEGDFTSAIRDSIAAGLVAGGLAAFLANPGTAIPAFKTAFWAALTLRIGERVNEFEWIGVNERQERGEWNPV